MSLVSIIIPVYNAEKYIEKCIHSCINQTYKDIEIVLVDDGSQDGSYDICKKFSLEDKRVKVYQKENSGVSDTRNYGIAVSSGTYITFVDADDWILENAVESMVCIEEASHAGLVVASMVRCNASEDKVLEVFCLEKKVYQGKDIVRILFHNKEYALYRGACAKLYLSDVIKKNHLQFDPGMSFGEDTCFVLDYLRHIKKVKQISDRLYCYRDVQGQEKIKRYGLEDADYQWRNGNIIYQKGVKLLSDIGGQDAVGNGAGVLYLGMVRYFMNICAANRCTGREVVKKLRRIPFENTFIYTVKLSDIHHPIDKVVFLLVKKRLYYLLYVFFLCKIGLYNGLWKRIKGFRK